VESDLILHDFGDSLTERGAVENWRKANGLSDEWFLCAEETVAGPEPLLQVVLFPIAVLHVSHAERNDLWIHLLPTPTPYSEEIKKIGSEIRSQMVWVQENLGGGFHDYWCHVCQKWVKPFFDYVEESGPGIGLTNAQGITLFNRPNYTSERVRCRECGSVEVEKNITKRLLDKAQEQLKEQNELKRKAIKWVELSTLRQTKPIVAEAQRILHGLAPFY
jgi:hypothetical protein